MKKLICVVLSLGLVLSLSFNCFAEVDPDAYWYPLEDGSYGYDMVAYQYDCAVDMVQESGVDIDPESYWYIDENTGAYAYDYDSFMVDYNVAIAALPVEDSSVEADSPMAVDVPATDEPTEEVINDSTENDVVSDVLEDSESNAELELGEDTPMVYSVNDLRASAVADDGTSAVDGLKAVIASIFGTYEPVTTTAVVTETVDGETVTTLVDVVASGSAGVDYEYLAGVLLFGIMLYCLFKLLGGIMS